MSFEGIVQIQNEDNPTDVNKRLSEGWELLAVNPSNDGMLYTVGRRAKPKAAEPQGERLSLEQLGERLA